MFYDSFFAKYTKMHSSRTSEEVGMIITKKWMNPVLTSMKTLEKRTLNTEAN